MEQKGRKREKIGREAGKVLLGQDTAIANTISWQLWSCTGSAHDWACQQSTGGWRGAHGPYFSLLNSWLLMDSAGGQYTH